MQVLLYGRRAPVPPGACQRRAESQAELEPCGRKEDLPCGDGLECKQPNSKRLSKGFCRCKFRNDVCGSDGKSYGNVCQLKATSRKALQQGHPGITQIQKGPCENSTGEQQVHWGNREVG
ncbi:hypothetical protein KUCAC02_033322 [Chaenocephalus aceratus]|nr:hypothetical protein KUCAC02_033322 [Chaenocephalus aceratus]